MATDEQHIQQFERNTVVAQRLTQFGDYDWAVIALFYASLHLVQTYLVRKGIDVRNHAQRNREIIRDDEVRLVYNSYRELRNYSEAARYECRQFSLEEFEVIRSGVFNSFVTHMRSLLEGR